MTVDARPMGAAPHASWLVASGLALGAVVAANAFAGQHRWWANFVLFPGAAIVATAIPLIKAGRAREAAGYPVLCVGVLVSAVGALLLFGAMGRGWPLMISLPCLAIAGTARWRAPDPNGRAAHRTVVGIALVGAGLGAAFLAIGAELVDVGGVRWWGFFVIAAGLVAIGNGLSLVGDLRGYRLSAIVLLTGPGVAAVLVGLRELLWR